MKKFIHDFTIEEALLKEGWGDPWGRFSWGVDYQGPTSPVHAPSTVDGYHVPLGVKYGWGWKINNREFANILKHTNDYTNSEYDKTMPRKTHKVKVGPYNLKPGTAGPSRIR